MTWIIEGAKTFIRNGFKIEQPECVKQAIEDYRRENDWLSVFLEEKCLLGYQYAESGGDLYREYRSYSLSMGEFARSAAEFKQALERVGIRYKKTKAGAVYKGLKLKDYLDIQRDRTEAAKEA